QVSGGAVPANLQRAFDRLVADLQSLSAATAVGSPAPVSTGSSSSASGSGSGTAADTGGATSAQSLLLKFLTTLQQDLGYGPVASTASTANGLIVNQVA
ncbi:MAG TPA: hypothetical protein VEY89_04455, partial [Candidatus Dormibacteraeota bacterium]|nr:hypothetical protein [Candidatus Dormibacteraeota bacterium]